VSFIIDFCAPFFIQNFTGIKVEQAGKAFNAHFSALLACLCGAHHGIKGISAGFRRFVASWKK